MTNTLKKIFIVTVSVLICDGLRLRVIANSFYFENLRHLVSANGDKLNVNYSAAAAVYFFLFFLWGGTLYLIAALSLKSAQKFGIVK